MNCGEVKELIQLYLDNELDARSTLVVQQHLESCSGCSRQLNALLVQDQTLKQAALAETVESSRVRAEILNAIAQEIQEERPRQINRTVDWLPAGWIKRSRIAAAAVLALAAILLALRGGMMPGVNEAVYAAVAADHAAHCSVDMTMGAVTDPGELLQLVTTAAKLKGVPDLSAFGYGDPRGRFCKVSEVEFLHLVYYHATQPPISLFLRPHDSNLIPERLTTFHSGSFNVASVSQSGMDLLVVTSLAEEETSSITRTIASRL